MYNSVSLAVFCESHPSDHILLFASEDHILLFATVHSASLPSIAASVSVSLQFSCGIINLLSVSTPEGMRVQANACHTSLRLSAGALDMAMN